MGTTEETGGNGSTDGGAAVPATGAEEAVLSRPVTSFAVEVEFGAAHDVGDNVKARELRRYGSWRDCVCMCNMR